MPTSRGTPTVGDLVILKFPHVAPSPKLVIESRGLDILLLTDGGLSYWVRQEDAVVMNTKQSTKMADFVK